MSLPSATSPASVSVVLQRIRACWFSPSQAARRLRGIALAVLAVCLACGTTPLVQVHAHSLAGVHGHAHSHAHPHVFADTFAIARGNHLEAVAAEPGTGNPLESSADDAGSVWHVHAGTLLPGAALMAADGFPSLDVSAPGPEPAALAPVAFSTGAPEAPLRPPRQPS
jgi:hypothetical protein